MGEAAIRPTALEVGWLILILSDINVPEISGLEPRKAQREHMFSAVHPTTDIAEILRHIRFVPTTDIGHRLASGLARDR